MANEQKGAQASRQEAQPASRSDTTAPGGAQPVAGRDRPTGSDIVGAAGGTDAAAGAAMSGNHGPGGGGLRQAGDRTGLPGSPGGNLGGDMVSPGAGGGAAGGTALGEANTADDTRNATGTPGGGMGVAGGDPSAGTPPKKNSGGASAG